MANKRKKAPKELLKKEEHAGPIPSIRPKGKKNANSISTTEKIVYNGAIIVGVIDIIFFVFMMMNAEKQDSYLGRGFQRAGAMSIGFPIAAICAIIVLFAGIFVRRLRVFYFGMAFLLAVFIPLYIMLS